MISVIGKHKKIFLNVYFIIYLNVKYGGGRILRKKEKIRMEFN